MALKTKLEVVQEIRYELYGGIVSADARLSENFVLRKVNDKIAAACMANAFQTTNMEGVTYADDFFYIVFTDIVLLVDTSAGLKYFELPAMPVGLPRQRSLYIYPPRVKGGLKSDIFKPIGRHEVQRMTSQPPIGNKVFFFIQDARVYFVNSNGLTTNYDKVNLTIASADGGLEETLNLPQDQIDSMKSQIIAELRVTLATEMDLTNDGQEIRQKV